MSRVFQNNTKTNNSTNSSKYFYFNNFANNDVYTSKRHYWLTSETMCRKGAWNCESKTCLPSVRFKPSFITWNYIILERRAREAPLKQDIPLWPGLTYYNYKAISDSTSASSCFNRIYVICSFGFAITATRDPGWKPHSHTTEPFSHVDGGKNELGIRVGILYQLKKKPRQTVFGHNGFPEDKNRKKL